MAEVRVGYREPPRLGDGDGGFAVRRLLLLLFLISRYGPYH
jgi:hypothetical protein